MFGAILLKVYLSIVSIPVSIARVYVVVAMATVFGSGMSLPTVGRCDAKTFYDSCFMLCARDDVPYLVR